MTKDEIQDRILAINAKLRIFGIDAHCMLNDTNRKGQWAQCKYRFSYPATPRKLKAGYKRSFGRYKTLEALEKKADELIKRKQKV